MGNNQENLYLFDAKRQSGKYGGFQIEGNDLIVATKVAKTIFDDVLSVECVGLMSEQQKGLETV